MTLLELADACEKAGPDEQRELLEKAHKEIHGDEPWWCQCYADDIELRHSARWFRNKIEAEAYLDAAMMLVPEAMRDEIEIKTLYRIARVALNLNHGPDGGPFYGSNECNSIPLALLAAILRARSEQV